MKKYIPYDTSQKAKDKIAEINSQLDEVLNANSKRTLLYQEDPVLYGGKFHVGLFDDVYERFFTEDELKASGKIG